MNKHKIRNSIRKHRFEHDEMTQQELADIVNASRQTIVAIEKDKYSPSLDLAFRIATAFDKDIGEVFSYQDNKKGEQK